MKKQGIFLTLLFVAVSLVASAQERVMVKFTARDQNGNYCPFTQMDVSNLTRGWTETFVYPDTTLILTEGEMGLADNVTSTCQLGAAWPNPFKGETCVPLELSESTNVMLRLIRVDGGELASYSMRLDAGDHQVKVRLSYPGLAFLIVTTPWGRSVAKLVNTDGGCDNAIRVETMSAKNLKGEESFRYDVSGEFALGDMMRYVGKTVIGSNTIYSDVVVQEQYADETIVLSFTTAHENVPLELCKDWGMSRSEVISFANAYEIIDDAEDVVAFSATSHSRDTLMMYLFDSDSLYCTTILVSSGVDSHDQLAASLLEGYFFMETQNDVDVFMNETQTTVAVSKIDDAELAISWVAVPQTVVDTTVPYTGVIAGHEYVDLGLSVKWATCNIGADVPAEIGYYFQNGETHPETSGQFNWGSYDYWTDLNGNGWVEPNEIGILIPDISGTQYDAARVMWTETWRMPTNNEIQELINNCQFESVVEGGHNCFRVTGPNGQSILLPASGYKSSSGSVSGASRAYIWSSTRHPLYEDEAYNGVIQSNASMNNMTNCTGLVIRPVSD